MSELREKMIKAMDLRNFSPRTQTAYLCAVTNLSKHYMMAFSFHQSGEAHIPLHSTIEKSQYKG